MTYPLIKELGLKLCHTSADLTFVHAEELERLLEKAPKAYGQMHSSKHGSFTTHANPHKQEWPLAHTHTATLLNVQPIERDSDQSEITKRIAEINKLSREIEVDDMLKEIEALDKVRDELAESWAEPTSLSPVEWSQSHDEGTYSAGFDAAVELLWPVIEAAEFASMPLTTPAHQATVAELIHTMENDANAIRKALSELKEKLK